MIVLPPPLLKAIVDAAEAAYPEECCGLLAGQETGDGDIHVNRAQPSPNVTEADPRDSFLVDAKIQFDLMRDLGDGPDRIVGHYHSHPDHPAQPSERDRQTAFYPDHVWVIVGVDAGRADAVAAYRLDSAEGDFQEIPLNQ